MFVKAPCRTSDKREVPVENRVHGAHVCMCVCVSACVCVRVRVSMRVYLHVYIQAYLCSMHTHTTLHYIPYSWIALHCITLDYIALHYKPRLLSSPRFDTGIVGWGLSWGVRGGEVRNAGSMWNRTWIL